MGKRSEIVFIDGILESIDLIKSYTFNLTEDEFISNSEKQDAVIRRLEIIGEAVKNVSSDLRKEYPNIPWKELAGMRDIVIHNYFGVNLGIIWVTITQELLPIEKEVKKIYKSLLK